ncbi:MAG: undecaprenyl-phosphate glucose phosphotransferase [Rhodocyclaceae bacterium]|nr:MAG: undecaprenyl-phosphate glucose phosphotransferase [Rhodocyclaceae bacterium]
MIGITFDPVVVVATLFASALYAEDNIGAPHVVLALIAFSLTFPGTSRLQQGNWELAREVLGGWLSITLMLLFFGYATGYLRQFERDTVLTWFFLAPTVLIIGNMLLRLGLTRALSTHGNQRLAVIAGMNEIGQRLAQQFRENHYLGTRLVGFFDDRDRLRLGALGQNQTLLGRIDTLAAFVKDNRIDAIYVTLPMATQPRILSLLDALKDTTASIYFAPDIFVTDLIQGRLENLAGMPVVAVCESPFTGVDGLIKRSSDIVLSLLILILIAPLLAAIALGVKFSSPGPVLFKQRRYGVDGQEIVVFKFRSMTVLEDGNTIAQATRNDKRITPFGAFLRRTSLDELPQFFNVLQGRMSIVGPRPHAIAHNELYRKLVKGYMVRHKVKPGITGLAQINGYRGETDTVDKMEARIDYDLQYLRNWSLGLDLWIILKTALVVIHDRHAY